MKLAMKDKWVYSVFWAVMLLSHALSVGAICAQNYGVQYISYASNIKGNFDIYLMDTNGENFRPLTNDLADEKDPTWSPDGRFLAYASNRDGDSKIYVTDTRTGEHRRLTDRHEQEWSPAWSPDGKWIAFVSYDRGNERIGIYVIDTNGRRLRRLNDQRVQALNGIFRGGCAWSPDGKRIGFSIIMPKAKRMHLCVIDADGKNFRQLTQGGPIVRAKEAEKIRLPVPLPLPEIGSPAWCPDGKWIAYVYSDTVFGETADIYVIDAEGNGRGKPFVKEIGKDISPAWVPEGFLSVSPSIEKQTTLWGRLKQAPDTTK